MNSGPFPPTNRFFPGISTLVLKCRGRDRLPTNTFCQFGSIQMKAILAPSESFSTAGISSGAWSFLSS